MQPGSVSFSLNGSGYGMLDTDTKYLFKFYKKGGEDEDVLLEDYESDEEPTDKDEVKDNVGFSLGLN